MCMQLVVVIFKSMAASITVVSSEFPVQHRPPTVHAQCVKDAYACFCGTLVIDTGMNNNTPSLLNDELLVRVFINKL